MNSATDDLADPSRILPANGITSCEHCRTVTWAGVPACDCEFGQLAIDEVYTRMLLDDRPRERG